MVIVAIECTQCGASPNIAKIRNGFFTCEYCEVTNAIEGADFNAVDQSDGSYRPPEDVTIATGFRDVDPDTVHTLIEQVVEKIRKPQTHFIHQEIGGTTSAIEAFRSDGPEVTIRFEESLQ